MKKTLLAIITLSAIAGLTACGGKGGSGSASSTSKITPYEQERLDSAKAVLKAEYGNYDEKNQCSVAKAPDGVEYCMGFDKESAQGATADKAYNLLAYSKGKMVNGVFQPTNTQKVNGLPQSDDSGVYSMFRYVKDGNGFKVTNRLPFVKAWEKDNVHNANYILNGTDGPVSHFSWFAYATTRSPERTVETLKVYSTDKNTFKSFLTLNTVYVDKASNTNIHARVYPDGKSAPGSYMWPLDVTISGRLNGKDVPQEVIKINYNEAKGVYDIPQRLKELTGAVPTKP